MKNMFISLAIISFFALAVVPVFASIYDISGSWSCCADEGKSNARFEIRDTGGALEGELVSVATGAVTAYITGSIKGEDVYIYSKRDKSGKAREDDQVFQGKILGNGTQIVGKFKFSWQKNNPTVEGWTWVLNRLTPVVPEIKINEIKIDKIDTLSVVRIVDIKNKNDKPGQPPGPITLEFFRDGKWQFAEENSTLRIGDKLRTGPDTIVLFEFLVGGRVGLKPNAEVTITSDRGIKETLSTSIHLRRAANLGTRITKTVVISVLTGVLFPLVDDEYSRALKSPIEIQTNGGILGIRG